MKLRTKVTMMSFVPNVHKSSVFCKINAFYYGPAVCILCVGEERACVASSNLAWRHVVGEDGRRWCLYRNCLDQMLLSISLYLDYSTTLRCTSFY